MVDRLRSASDRLSRELAHAGLPPSLRRAARRWDTEPSAPTGRRAVGVAATLLVAVAVVLSAAVPDLRDWIMDRGARVADVVTERSPGPVSGLQVTPPSDGELTVSVVGAAPGARVTVELVEDGRAGVWSRGATFEKKGPDLVVRPTSGEDVKVRIPRSAASAALEVNGARWLALREGRVETMIAPEARSEEEIVFRVPGSGGPR
jgi:hypothetical protein